MNKSTYFSVLFVFLAGCLIWGNQKSTLADGIFLELEAEKADSIKKPFEVAFDSAASGGGYVIISKGSMDEFRRAGKATFHFTVEVPNTILQIWIRAKSDNPCVNSFYLAVDGKRRMIAGAGKTEGDWIWIRNSDMGLSRGKHTLDIMAREESCLLDKIILTSRTAYTPI